MQNRTNHEDKERGAEEPNIMDNLTKSPKEILNKIFKKTKEDDEKPKTITAPMDKPHSIVDEVFSWIRKS